MLPDYLNETELAYAQAQAYGKDLARLYATEKNRRKEFETANQKLRVIFDTVPNGLAVIDGNLNIVEVNARFLALFEQTSTCVGQPISNLLPVEVLNETIRSARSEVAGLRTVEVEITHPISRHLLVTLSPVSDKQGWVLILYDLTERKRLEELKNEFINIAAHELRTPLAGAIGFASVLQENIQDADPAMINELVSLILQSTDRLRTIVDELIIFAATHRDNLDNLHVIDVDLGRLVRKAFKMLQSQCDSRKLACRLELPYEPFIVHGDQFILSEAIYHLVDNAVTFNKPGGQVIVRVQSGQASMTETDEVVPVTLVEVEDTGIGIPKIELEKIFDKFYQVEEHLTRAVGGLGLGLTIARRGIEQHGGRITVTSQLGEGSVFRIVLPAVIQLNNVSMDDRLDMAHHQTLAYAKDMARAVVSQRQLSRKLQQVKTLSGELQAELDDLAQTASLSHAVALSRAQRLVNELLQLSA